MAPKLKLHDDAYVGLFGDIARAFDGKTEAGSEGILMSAIALASAAVGPSPYVWQATRQPLTIHTVLIAGTGAMKGTATGHALDIFEQALDGFEEEYVLEDVPESGRQFVLKLAERASEVGHHHDNMEDEEEAIYDIKPGFPAVYLWTEFPDVMENGKRDKSLETRQRVAWEGKTLRANGPKGRVTLRDPHLAIIGHATEHEFLGSLKGTVLAGGSINRKFLIGSQSPGYIKVPKPLPADLTRQFADTLRERIESGRKLGEITLTEKALTLWVDEIHDEIVRRYDPELDGNDQMALYFRRARTQCWRIAALYAIMAGRKQIDTVALKAGFAWVMYSMDTVEAMLAKANGVRVTSTIPRIVGDASSAIDEVTTATENALRAAGPEGITRKPLHAAVKYAANGYVSADDLDNALAALGDRVIYGGTTRNGKGGRPPSHYTLRDTSTIEPADRPSVPESNGEARTEAPPKASRPKPPQAARKPASVPKPRGWATFGR